MDSKQEKPPKAIVGPNSQTRSKNILRPIAQRSLTIDQIESGTGKTAKVTVKRTKLDQVEDQIIETYMETEKTVIIEGTQKRSIQPLITSQLNEEPVQSTSGTTEVNTPDINEDESRDGEQSVPKATDSSKSRKRNKQKSADKDSKKSKKVKKEKKVASNGEEKATETTKGEVTSTTSQNCQLDGNEETKADNLKESIATENEDSQNELIPVQQNHSNDGDEVQLQVSSAFSPYMKPEEPNMPAANSTKSVVTQSPYSMLYARRPLNSNYKASSTKDYTRKNQSLKQRKITSLGSFQYNQTAEQNRSEVDGKATAQIYDVVDQKIFTEPNDKSFPALKFSVTICLLLFSIYCLQNNNYDKGINYMKQSLIKWGLPPDWIRNDSLLDNVNSQQAADSTASMAISQNNPSFENELKLLKQHFPNQAAKNWEVIENIIGELIPDSYNDMSNNHAQVLLVAGSKHDHDTINCLAWETANMAKQLLDMESVLEVNKEGFGNFSNEKLTSVMKDLFFKANTKAMIMYNIETLTEDAVLLMNDYINPRKAPKKQVLVIFTANLDIQEKPASDQHIKTYLTKTLNNDSSKEFSDSFNSFIQIVVKNTFIANAETLQQLSLSCPN